MAATMFPKMETQTLRGESLTFPDDVNGEVTLLILLFQDWGRTGIAQQEASAWAEFLKIELPSGSKFYEIPMLSTIFSMSKGMLNEDLTKEIPSVRHDRIACFYGDKVEIKVALDIEDFSHAHAFLLNTEGKIIAAASGLPEVDTAERFKNSL